jgi:SPP1 gp7 family putative phage head morphogenesis protein
MAINYLLKQQILIANKGKIRIKKPKKWLYPAAVERIYTRQIQSINEIFWNKVRELIIPSIPFLVGQANSIRGDEERVDSSWVDQLRQIVDKTYFDFSKAVGKEQLDVISMEQAKRISTFNKSEFVKVIHSAVGVNPIIQESWLEPQMKAFQAENTDLITKLSTDQRYRIKQNLHRSLSQGKGIKAIKEDLDKDEAIGKNRSRLIARDQTNKFNGQLAELRQKELGIEKYTWSSSRDERVRITHRELDGKIFDWKNPPSEGHPGQPIQCRCTAQPIITDQMFD